MAGTISPELQAIVDTASRTRVLHLTNRSLTQVPPVVWTLTNLVRLDLGGNCLKRLPDDLAKLTRLEELWLNGNPLAELPPCIERCRALRVIDLRGTNVVHLPRELSRLKRIIDIDLRDAPLAPKLASAYGPGCDTQALMVALKRVDEEAELRLRLERKLRDTVRVGMVVARVIGLHPG